MALLLHICDDFEKYEHVAGIISGYEKLAAPQSMTDEKVRGPVKKMGGPIKLLYVIMFEIIKWLKIHFYTPRFNEVERGVYWFHLVHLSIRPSVQATGAH